MCCLVAGVARQPEMGAFEGISRPVVIELLQGRIPVDQFEFLAIVFRMAFRAIFLFLLRQIKMIALFPCELRLNFAVALEAGPGEAFFRVAFFAIHDDLAACHRLMNPGELAR